MLIHQSDLKSWARCPQQWKFSHDGAPREQLSATAYGSVMHHAMHVLERTGDLQAALDTFEFYWHPLNIEAVCEPVQIWIYRDSYGSLRQRGLETLRRYAALLPYRDEELLALEYEFVVPIHGTVDRVTGESHYLGGTVDRLALRHYKRRLTVCIDDLKTGKKPTYLRHNLQGTAYAYATLQPEFWEGNPAFNADGFGPERAAALMARVDGAPRMFTWIDLRALDFVPGGYRGPRDYERFRLAAQAFADSVQAEIFPLSIEGEVCQYCPYRRVCGGVGLDDMDGHPDA